VNQPPLPVGRVTKLLGISADTLRYYERRGILPPPARTSSGRRVYGEADLHLIEVLLHLRRTGMPLAQIAEFTEYVARDPHGVPERLAMLNDHRALVAQRIAQLENSLTVIDQKIADYTQRITSPESTRL